MEDQTIVSEVGAAAIADAEPQLLPGNYAATMDEVGFVDLAGGNYRLAPTSPYRNAGSDGLDVGANIDAVVTP